MAKSVAISVAEQVLERRSGTFTMPLSELAKFRDVVYASDPVAFKDAQILLWAKSAFLWMATYPAVVQVQSQTILTASDVSVIPGISVAVGSSPSSHSLVQFWKAEAKLTRNRLGAALIALSVILVSWSFGVAALNGAPTPLAVLFGVALPTIPLFFRPIGLVDPVPFLVSGRLAAWQMAERQLFTVAAIGFVLSLFLQSVAPASESPALVLSVYAAGVSAALAAALWILLTITNYALPLTHALEVSAALKQYASARSKGATRTGPPETETKT